VQDIGHVCRASGVAAEIDATSIPLATSCRHALGGAAMAFAATAGEDYELLLTASARRRAHLVRLAPRLGCRLTPLRRVVRGRPVVGLLGARGQPLALRRGGFDHFR